MEEVHKGCPMIRMDVSGWMFLLVPAYPGSPRPKAVKRLCVCDPERCIQMCGDQWSCPTCWLMIARLTFPLSETLSVYPNNMGVAARSSPSPADGGWAGEVTTATRRRRCCHPLPWHQSPFIFQSRSVTFTADTYRYRLTAQGRWIGIGWKWRTRSNTSPATWHTTGSVVSDQLHWLTDSLHSQTTHIQIHTEQWLTHANWALSRMRRAGDYWSDQFR